MAKFYLKIYDCKMACQITSFIEKHGDYLNRLLGFVTSDFAPECNFKRNDQAFIETSCENTGKTLLRVLGGDEYYTIDLSSDSYNRKDVKQYIQALLQNKHLIVVHIESLIEDDIFPNHVFGIVEESPENYSILESYYFQYPTRVCRATLKTFNLYIEKYLDIVFSKQWTVEDINQWKKLTGIDLPDLLDRPKNLMISIDYPEKGFDSKNCIMGTKQLLEDAVEKLNYVKDILETLIPKTRETTLRLLNDGDIKDLQALAVIKNPFDIVELQKISDDALDKIQKLKKDLGQKFTDKECRLSNEGYPIVKSKSRVVTQI